MAYLGDLPVPGLMNQPNPYAAANAVMMLSSMAHNLEMERARHPAPVVSAPPSSPVSVNVGVSPSIATQVSPQISPNFQQQFQPTGSPMVAGTTQQAPAQGASTGLTAADVQRMLDTQAAQAAQAQAIQAAQAQAAQAAQLAAQQAAEAQAQKQAAFQAAQVGTGGGGAVTGTAIGGELPITPEGKTVNQAQQPTAVSAQPTKYENSMILLTAVGLIIAYLALPNEKGAKRHASRRS